jgi:hypothetical protein
VPASVKCGILERSVSSSGRCGFKGSSVFGAGLQLPVLSRTQSAEQLGDAGRARANLEGIPGGIPQLPTSHRLKVVNAEAFEQLRIQKSNSEYSHFLHPVIVCSSYIICR